MLYMAGCEPGFPCAPSRQVFTIHNMDFGQIKLGEAAFYSQKFTTVSPSYAWEVRGCPLPGDRTATPSHQE